MRDHTSIDVRSVSQAICHMDAAVVLVAVITVITALFLRVKDKLGLRRDMSCDLPDCAPESLDKTFDQLCKLSLDIRTACFSEDVIALFDNLVDKLLAVLPRLRSLYPSDELTYVIRRMAEVYLADLILPYTKMTPESRGKHQEELCCLLKDVELELTDILNALDKRESENFQAQAVFLRRKLFGESGDAI